ncbi:polysaccharide deacetylase family protein [Erythrobacter sp. JK5]|nr:polysaccharide deacetylase family protein [Erythrobacter sp. JK5]
MIRLFALVCLTLAACFAPLTGAQAKEDRRIALTFDDVPRMAGAFMTADDRATRLRSALREAGVGQAAFFVNPGMLAKRPTGLDHIRAYAADGHVIANHTALHSSLSESTLAEFIADIDSASRFLDTIENTRPWFRFPYLDEGRADAARRDAVRAALAERGLLNGYVTVDASDWFYEQLTIDAARDGKRMDMIGLRNLYAESHVEAAEFNYALARNAVGYSPAHVMLLHETDLAALFIGDLVVALERAGWTIISADEAYADPFGRYAASYDTPSAQGTLTEQVAWQAGLPAPRWYARNNTELAAREFRTRVLGEPAGPEG